VPCSVGETLVEGPRDAGVVIERVLDIVIKGHSRSLSRSDAVEYNDECFVLSLPRLVRIYVFIHETGSTK